jgi:hypothetical protein
MIEPSFVRAAVRLSPNVVSVYCVRLHDCLRQHEGEHVLNRGAEGLSPRLAELLLNVDSFCIHRVQMVKADS